MAHDGLEIEAICPIHDHGSDFYESDAAYSEAIWNCPTCSAFLQQEADADEEWMQMLQDMVCGAAELAGEQLDEETTARRMIELLANL